MDRYILQLADLACTGFEKVGLDRARLENCFTEDGKYSLATSLIIGMVIAFVVPTSFSGLRTFFNGRDRRKTDPKEK